MDPTTLSPSLVKLDILDDYESLIWNEKFCGPGDFELVFPASSDMVSKCQKGYFVKIKESNVLMIIEKIRLLTSLEDPDKIIVSGKSLESMLDYRIIWNPTVLDGNLQNGIKQLINENAINPTDSNRDITRLIFEDSTDPLITALTVKAQFFGELLGDAITNICASKKIGYKITLNSSNQFVFKLYTGVDRSHGQLTNPYVVFSPDFDNLLTGEYVDSNSTLRTIAMVAGEKGVANQQRIVTVNWTEGPGTDLTRREMFVDASGVSRNLPNDVVLTDQEYDDQLAQKGLEDLSMNESTKTFEGSVDPGNMFLYGFHFFMGDTVQIIDEYGNSTKSKVTGFVRSEDASGSKFYPTFTTIEL